MQDDQEPKSADLRRLLESDHWSWRYSESDGRSRSSDDPRARNLEFRPPRTDPTGGNRFDPSQD